MFLFHVVCLLLVGFCWLLCFVDVIYCWLLLQDSDAVLDCWLLLFVVTVTDCCDCTVSLYNQALFGNLRRWLFDCY